MNKMRIFEVLNQHSQIRSHSELADVNLKASGLFQIYIFRGILIIKCLSLVNMTSWKEPSFVTIK